MQYQYNIYQYLAQDQDPVYQKIDRLPKGQHLHGKKVTITHNRFGIYEVTTSHTEDSFSSCLDCYEYVTKFMDAL